MRRGNGRSCSPWGWHRARPSRRWGLEFRGPAVPAALDAAVEAAEDREEDETADGGGDADDDGFVGGEPGADFAAEGRAFALALWRERRSAFLGWESDDEESEMDVLVLWRLARLGNLAYT